MSMRKRTHDLEILLYARKNFSFQRHAHYVNNLRREMGNIPYCFVLDLSLLPICSAQQVRFIYLSLVFSSGGGYVNWSVSARHEDVCYSRRNRKSREKAPH